MTQFSLNSNVIILCLVLLLFTTNSANRGKKRLIIQEIDFYKLIKVYSLKWGNYKYLHITFTMIREINAFDLAESSRNYPYTYWETESSKGLDHRIQKVLCKKSNADNAYKL